MRTSQVVRHFRELRPDLSIGDVVIDGARRHQFMVKRSDARRAIPGDPCQCTIARGTRRALPAAEAIVLGTTAYLLERRGRTYQAVKYLHDGDTLVKVLDAIGVPVWNTTVTLRPPSPMRRVGVQTPAQKARQPKRRKQSAEHVARRVASRAANPASQRQRRVGIGA